MSKRNPRLMEGQDDYSFRRSRTITGSVSENVRAAGESHSNLKSHRLKHQDLKKHRNGLGVLFVTTVTLAVLVAYTIGQFIFLPAGIRYTGELIHAPDTSAYIKAMEVYFARHSMERFAFSLNQAGLKNHMQQAHPEVLNIQIESSYLGKKDISMEFRKPLLAWKAGGKELFVDDKGQTFTRNYFDPPAVTVEDKSGADLGRLDVIASSRFISFLGLVSGNINKAGVGKVAKVVIPAGTLRQVDIYLSGREYPIKTHIDRHPFVQAGDVVGAVKYIESHGITPEYVDARVQGKAFYKDR